MKTPLVSDAMSGERHLDFFVAGQPQPKGSTRAFVVKGRPIITSSNKNLKQWELRVAHEAQANVPSGFCDGESCYHVIAYFHFAEPKSHSKKFAFMHTTRPDIDKCLRAVLDGLTGICFEDDSQVFWVTADKNYGDPGVDIFIDKFPGKVPR